MESIFRVMPRCTGCHDTVVRIDCSIISATGEEEIKVKENSILRLDLDVPIIEIEKETPFAFFSFGWSGATTNRIGPSAANHCPCQGRRKYQRYLFECDASREPAIPSSKRSDMH